MEEAEQMEELVEVANGSNGEGRFLFFTLYYN